MSNKVKVPEGYHQVIPYLIVSGAEKFIAFLKEVFDGTEKMKHKRDEQVVMHAEVLIGDTYLMFADATETYSAQTGSFFIYVDDADARYDKALNAGCTAITELSDQSYGRSGGVKDPFGNVWWITSVIG